MRKEKIKQATDLCHNCQYGGQVVERCSCPDLKAGGIMPRTRKTITALANAETFAQLNELGDYNPLPFVAVTHAVINQSCRYYKAIR